MIIKGYDIEVPEARAALVTRARLLLGDNVPTLERSVIHISVERAPTPLWLVARPSIKTLATLLASCPVTTRRTGGGRFEKSFIVVHSLE